MAPRILLASLLGLVVLLTAACGDDPADDTDDAADAAEEETDDGDDGEGIGSGNAEASSVTFNGEDLEVHRVICTEVAVEDDALRVLAEVGDPDENLEVAVNEASDGARVRITRGVGDPEFSGHSWYTPSGSEDAAEIDVDGARGDLELRWDTSSGHDEDDEVDARDIAFDLVCD